MKFSIVSVLSVLVVTVAVILWQFAVMLSDSQTALFPSPLMVIKGICEEAENGRLLRDIGISLSRVALGFGLAISVSIPMGLWISQHPHLCASLLPLINFFRNLSPLAWIPFAIMWFGIGHAPAIFLIFLSTVFPMLMATISAVENVPRLYAAIAREYGFSDRKITYCVTLPAILPHLLVSLRMSAGIAWMVIVAAEMIAGKDGLGFAIVDARNGLRLDLLVVSMIVIGLIGVAIDCAFAQLHRLPALRWSHA